MEQIQIGYNAIHDRMIMSIKAGDETHKVWLTRRFVMLYLAQLHQTTQNDPVIKAHTGGPHQSEIMAFQKQQAETQGKINKSKEPVKISLQEGEPLLACGIKIDNQTLHIDCTNKRRLTLGLSTGLAYSLINLIEQSLKHTGWGFTGVKPVAQKNTDVTVKSSWSATIN